MRRLGMVLLILFVFGSSAWGWWPRGHGILTRAAVQALPADAPAFLRAGAGMVAHAAVDPDVAKIAVRFIWKRLVIRFIILIWSCSRQGICPRLGTRLEGAVQSWGRGQSRWGCCLM